ncbi:hypothetical protein Tco_0822219 [Tanacetum coccineum]|uniref:Uncharacterized protein n=1 Tax=Tanacetum coccineum TaxID=301880 RepID=A0ABQ5AEI9_9ASTR
MESQEGKNSNLSDASSAKYDIQVGPALCASCAKNRFFFPVLKQLGRNRVLPGNHGFFSFRHWLLVEPLEWNEIRISGDLSSPLTRNRLSLHASGSHVPSSTGSTNGELSTEEDELQLKVIEAGKQSEYAGGSYLTRSRAETRSNKAAIFLSCTLHIPTTYCVLSIFMLAAQLCTYYWLILAAKIVSRKSCPSAEYISIVSLSAQCRLLCSTRKKIAPRSAAKRRTIVSLEKKREK